MHLMPRLLLLASLFLMVASSCQKAWAQTPQPRTVAGTEEAAPEGFVPLFNGINLDGWMVRNPDNRDWRVVGGVIDCDPHEGPGDRNLWTSKSYGDFELLVDWRIKESPYINRAAKIILPDGTYKEDGSGKDMLIEVPNTDSGIFLRGQHKSQVNIWLWPVGSGEVWGYRTDPALSPQVHAGVTPKVKADRPMGQWNTFHIVMQGDRLTVTLNGQRVLDHAQLPGIPLRGPIALQHHGDRKDGEWGASFLQFRRILIKELDTGKGFPNATHRVWGPQLSLNLPTGRPEVFERVEISVDGVPVADNPFDPESIALDLEVTPPSGEPLRVPGYFQRDFDRKLEGNREVLTPEGEGSWRLRWLPLEAGRHTLVATVTLGGKLAARGETTIEVAAGKRHGLARVEPDGRRYFRLDDGTPLFLNGLCACWHGRRGTYDYDDWLAAYQKAGINYIRIWMWHQAFGIEWDKSDKVHYRLDNAWRLDRVLAEAEQRSVFVMLCLDYHGIFEVKPDYWGGNNFWPRHPYNAVNGGPCQTQNDFFTNDEAKKLYAKRLRYLVARWSAFPNLLAWEFFNEIDNEYAYLKHKDVIAWHQEMGRRLRSIDPCRHLISSSFTGGSERPDLFALPEMDFAQYHSYNQKHPAQMTAEKAAKFFEKYQKPFFVSEYGTDWKGWKPDTDPHFRALHQAIWSGVFTGAAGTDMTWWWESIHTANLYQHWSALSSFLDGTGIGRPDLRPVRFENVEGSVTPFGVGARDEALVWLLDRAYDWPDGALEANPVAAKSVKVTLGGVSDGAWSIEWWDTLAGKRLATSEATASGGVLQLAPPAFQVDIAARLKRR